MKQADLIRVRAQLQFTFQPASPINRRELFAGRIKQVGQILGAIAQTGQHVILYGERGVGKTSLANLVHTFWDDVFSLEDELVAPRVNCDTTDTFESIWAKVLEEITLIYDKKGWELPSASAMFQATLHEISQNAATPGSLRRFLDLADKEFVIVIDEFDRLEDEDSRKLFADTIKTLSDHAVRATLILVGVADNVDELLEDHASIDRALIQVLMPRMSVEELEEILEKGLSSVGMTADKDVQTGIALLSQGLPHYVHLLGLNAGLAAVDDQRTEIKQVDLQAALRVAVEQAQETVLHAYHRATMSPRKTLYPEVLVACAMAPVDDVGYFAPVDVREPLSSLLGKTIGIPTYIRHLHKLSTDNRGSVLQKLGPEGKPRFRFVDPLLKPYIVFRALKEGVIDKRIVETLFRIEFLQSRGTRRVRQRHKKNG